MSRASVSFSSVDIPSAPSQSCSSNPPMPSPSSTGTSLPAWLSTVLTCTEPLLACCFKSRNTAPASHPRYLGSSMPPSGSCTLTCAGSLSSIIWLITKSHAMFANTGQSLYRCFHTVVCRKALCKFSCRIRPLSFRSSCLSTNARPYAVLRPSVHAVGTSSSTLVLPTMKMPEYRQYFGSFIRPTCAFCTRCSAVSLLICYHLLVC